MPINATEQNSIEKLNDTWGEGNVPPGLSLDTDESLIRELGFRRLCSFRAALVHKLTVIYRGTGSWDNAAHAIGVRTCIVRSWRAWKSCPRSAALLSKIDNEYETALERLRVEKARGRFLPPTSE